MARIEIVSNADNAGGASRAAYRLYSNLLSENADAKMRVREKKIDNWMVQGPATLLEKFQAFIRPRIGSRFFNLQKTTNLYPHSANILPSNWAACLNDSDADIVNLHWVGGETMSIEDIGRIRKPIVWTLHDMWAFCGAEHCTDDGPSARWRNGYSVDNRPAGSSGLDIDRLTWNRKLRAWQEPMHIVTPSRWLAECARQSMLMKDWPVHVIPNVLDTTVFKPLDKSYSRHALNLPADKKIILFGAIGGSHLKGYDLLVDALRHLAANDKEHNLACVVFGQGKPQHSPELPIPIRWMGHIHDDATLALLYSAADVMIIPSRQENLPQAGTEAHACGCPVVAFNCTGLPEVIDHLGTGYLAKKYDANDMACGIAWVLADSERHAALARAARSKAEHLWTAKTVIPAYLNVFDIAKSCSRSVRFGDLKANP